MAVTVITLLALIVAFIFILQQMSTLPAQPLQLYVSKQWGKLATKVETVNKVKPNIDCTILLVLPVASYDTCSRSEPYPWVYATPDGSNMRILVDVDGTRLQDIGLDTDVFWFALVKN